MEGKDAFVLRLISRINHPGVSLAILPVLKKYLGNKPEDLTYLAGLKSWEARWVATQKIPDLLPGQEGWQLLCELAQDPERNVREGAAHGLGFLLLRYPQLQEQYEAVLRDHNVSEDLRKAVLHSAVVLWRKYPDRIDTALSILTVGASQEPGGCFAIIGSYLVAIDLMKFYPEMARSLKEKWENSKNVNLQHHARRIYQKESETPVNVAGNF